MTAFDAVAEVATTGFDEIDETRAFNRQLADLMATFLPAGAQRAARPRSRWSRRQSTASSPTRSRWRGGNWPGRWPTSRPPYANEISDRAVDEEDDGAPRGSEFATHTQPQATGGRNVTEG
jgi:hypothetical protein